MQNIKILIVDDHALVGQAWKVILESDKNLEVVDVTSGADSVMKILHQMPVDVVMLDINMEPINGFDLAALIHKTHPVVKILAVSMHDQPSVVRRMIRSGAMGYVSKNARKEEMIEAIYAVMKHRKYVSHDIQQKIAEEVVNDVEEEQKTAAILERLTEKEVEVLRLVKEGFTSKEIAEQLGISYKTVQVHRHNILKKMQQRNTAGLLNMLNDVKFMI